MPSRKDVVDAAISLLGAPYKEKARGPEWDCLGLVVHAYKSAGFRVKDELNYSNAPDGTMLPRTRAIMRKLGGKQIGLNDKKPGDLIIMKDPQNRPAHFGILADDGELIHAHRVRGKVVKDPFARLFMKPCAAFTVAFDDD